MEYSDACCLARVGGMAEGYLRYPHIHDDQVVFVADDDLWLVGKDGGRAARLTTDKTKVRDPWFSPNGKKVAFASTAGVLFDAYVVDLESGERQRLTWLADPTLKVIGWQDADTVLISSSHDQMNRARQRIWAVGLDGKMTLLDLGLAESYAKAGDVEAITIPNFRHKEYWKRYRGGTAAKIWLRPGGGEWTRILPDITADCYPVGVSGDRFFFASDHEAALDENPDGQAQLYSVALRGEDLRKHTNFGVAEGYVRDPKSDGTQIVWHSRGKLYYLADLNAEPSEIKVDLPGVSVEKIMVEPFDRLQKVCVDRRGNGSLLEWRGAAWYLTHRGGPARALSSVDGVRVREPVLLGDEFGIWASDVEGEDCLEIGRLDGEGELRRICRPQGGEGKLGRVLHLAGSPDGRTAAAIAHDGRILRIDIESEQVTELDRSTEYEAFSPVYSPDSRYLVWQHAVSADGRYQLRCADLNDDSVHILTAGKFDDDSPRFTLDGKYLVFLSKRTFDPVYDEHSFDLSFPDSTRPWLVPLKADQPAPFGVAADGWPIAEIDPKNDDSDESEEKKSKGERPPKCEIDFAGFEQRMIAFPTDAGDFEDLFVTANGVAWIRRLSGTHQLGTARKSDKPADQLEHFNFETRKVDVIADGIVDASISGDGKYFVIRGDDELHVQPSDRKVDGDDDAHISIDMSRLNRQLDRRAEWRQMFDENGRLMANQFWREDMDGVDWAAVLDRYRPLVDRCLSHDDIVDVMYETIAELNTSHAYIIPRTSYGDQSRKLGLLGADLTLIDQGARIDRILDGDTSDPAARAPLLAAGVGARPGDVIVEINGQSVAAAGGVGPLLQGAAERPVELTLARDGQQRRVAVVPLASEQALRYLAWVDSRRKYVEQKSGGRLGYLHVPDMVASGWAQFHREIERASRHDGVVVDVRWNGGGHTSQLIIERLSRRLTNWDFIRHSATPGLAPSQSMRGPLVMVTNQWAGSDGDIVGAAFQSRQLGPVVGERSWGGVIGIDGRFELVDGTLTDQPRYATYDAKYGWELENHGVDPDVEVVVNPADFAAESERDVQLDKAIEIALDELVKHPAITPPVLPSPRVRRGNQR